ncbi:hypothetical protein AWR31_00985 [Campylobacter fetus subsp. venerealis]|nr:hypothetical protein AWR31_00985 [Campylobacter fetus subsp. venerealis]
MLIAIILLLKKDETKEQPTKNLEQPKQTQVITQKFSPSKIDDMLKKQTVSMKAEINSKHSKFMKT